MSFKAPIAPIEPPKCLAPHYLSPRAAQGHQKNCWQIGICKQVLLATRAAPQHYIGT